MRLNRFHSNCTSPPQECPASALVVQFAEALGGGFDGLSMLMHDGTIWDKSTVVVFQHCNGDRFGVADFHIHAVRYLTRHLYNHSH